MRIISEITGKRVNLPTNWALLRCLNDMTYKLLNLSLRIISGLPFRALYCASDGLGFVLYHLVRYRRKIVRRNLTECFPEKSPAEIKKLEKAFYRYFTDNVLESCKLASISPEQISKRMKFVNIDRVNHVLKSGRSVGLYLGHYGNWEWQSSMPLHLKLERGGVAAQIYHKLRSKVADKLMLNLRSRMGAVSVEMRQTARFITTEVSQGRECIVGFIADQSPRKKEVRHFVPFMHHHTPVLTGPEKIMKHYDFDPWFVKITRVKRGYYEAEFVHMHSDPKSLPDFKLTEIYYQMLEQTIRENPELYLWTHNRFKHAQLLPPAES